MQHIIKIPHWRPASLNKMKGHWAAHKLKKRDRNMIWNYCQIVDKIPPATGKRMIHMHITTKDRRQVDPDNVMKSLLDALKQCGMLVDDSDKWCDWTKPTLEVGDKQTWGTKITLEDIE